jgi:hypothetical protein
MLVHVRRAHREQNSRHGSRPNAKQWRCKLKRKTTTLAIAVAAFALVMAYATAAQATPTHTTACSGCHGSTTSITVGLTELSNNGTNASYQIALTGGSGVKGYTVLEGSTNVANAYSSGGTVSLKVGHTYAVWGVDSNLGARSKSITPSAPTTTPTPPPPTSTLTTSTLSITSTAFKINRYGYVRLSGRLSPAATGALVGVYAKKPGKTYWVRLSTRTTDPTTGAWSYRLKLSTRGNWYFRTKFGATTVQTAATSRTIKVYVR